MKIRICVATVVVALAPALVAAQENAPVAKAFRSTAARMEKQLIAAAEAVPEDKFAFKPTPAQMTFGQIMVHLAGGNDALCSAIGGVKAPAREKIASTASKAALLARLKESFEFCHTALAALDDSKLSDELTVFGEKMSRADLEMETAGDWADHYSQLAIYMRLNGLLPPTAKK
jgi:uncharacterized damage-inducible protein DinB